MVRPEPRISRISEEERKKRGRKEEEKRRADIKTMHNSLFRRSFPANFYIVRKPSEHEMKKRERKEEEEMKKS